MKTFVTAGGWKEFSIWDHSQEMAKLYKRRSLCQEQELTCHIQAAELLAPLAALGDSVLDVGCGSGYFFHSLARKIPRFEYFGIDPSPAFIKIGRDVMPSFGVDASRLIEGRIEDLHASVDHAVCINVISNIDNYQRPLERMLLSARKSVILRESFGASSSSLYVEDKFLDPGVSLKVYVNTYEMAEVQAFAESYGFEVSWVEDRYTAGQPQNVIGYPHYWNFMVAKRKGGK